MDPRKAAQLGELRRSQVMLRAAFKDFASVIQAHVEGDRTRSIALMNAEQAAMWANQDIAQRMKELE